MKQYVARSQPVGLRTVPPGRSTRPPAPRLRRAHLIERLEDAAGTPFVVLTAPAGWGKSSALADWADVTSRPVAWMSCTPADNEPARFFRRFAEAIAATGALISDDVVAVLRSPRPMPAEMIASLVNDDLAAHSGNLVIVLDDFHVVDAPVIREAMFGIATAGLANVTLVLCGRESPDWPLARLRAHGGVREFGIADLAFDATEIASLFHWKLDNSIVDQLAARSEGWAAGLHLALLWLQQGGEVAQVLEGFQGTHRDIADYLAEEVVAELPGKITRFLELSAVPDVFTASLAEKILGDDEADRHLREIERRGLFIVPLDEERRWYRYHGVFRQYLRKRLRERDAAAELMVDAVTSRWYEAEDDLAEAVTYALRAGEEQRAAELLDVVAEHLLLHRGEAHTLVRLGEQIPSSMILEQPSLLQFHAWALVLLGRLGEAAAMADRLVDMKPDALAEVASIRSRIAAYRGEQQEAIAQAKEALLDNGGQKQWFRADTLLSLGFAYRVVGEIDAALDAFAEATTCGWDCGFAHGALWGSRYHALTLISQGRLRDAADLVEDGFGRAVRSGLDRGAALAALLVSRGEIRYERNDLQDAREDLERALGIAHDVGDAKILMNAYVALSQLEQAAGHDEIARNYARRATMVFDGPGEKANEAWISLRQGNLPAVRNWLTRYTREVGSKPDICIGEAEQIMLGRAMLATGDLREAVGFLEHLRQQADASGRFGRSLTIGLLLADAASRSGDAEKACMYLDTVIELASREGYRRTLLDEGAPVMAMLKVWSQRDVPREHRQYVTRLLVPPVSGVGGEAGSYGTLLEPLTPRQVEVTRLLAEGLSNRDIAQRLFLSEGTVKAHLHQIYAKLMVRNRAEAIVAARDLDVLQGAPKPQINPQYTGR